MLIIYGMRVLFDYQTFSLQSFGGISRYYTELISGINQTKENEAYLSLLFSDNIHLTERGIGAKKFLPNLKIYKRREIIYRSNKLYTIAQLHKRKFDVFHATYYDPYFIPHLKGHPFTVTFLDMIHERFSSQYAELSDGGLTTKWKQVLANQAQMIIAISESTKRDIIEFLHIDPNKIRVIYLGNSFQHTNYRTIVEPFFEPYLLFVGRRERYKNFTGLLEAIYPLLKKFNIKLLCAGGDPFSKSENELIRSYDVSALVEQRSINDKILPLLYQNAVAFVFPTMYEGFGIPVLEAFACNCPCIVSNSSSLPEVAGDAALYIDPLRPESIAHAIEKLLFDSQLRQALIEKGRVRLNHFSWQRMVDDTLELYKDIS